MRTAFGDWAGTCAKEAGIKKLEHNIANAMDSFMISFRKNDTFIPSPSLRIFRDDTIDCSKNSGTGHDSFQISSYPVFDNSRPSGRADRDKHQRRQQQQHCGQPIGTAPGAEAAQQQRHA